MAVTVMPPFVEHQVEASEPGWRTPQEFNLCDPSFMPNGQLSEPWNFNEELWAQPGPITHSTLFQSDSPANDLSIFLPSPTHASPDCWPGSLPHINISIAHASTNPSIDCAFDPFNGTPMNFDFTDFSLPPSTCALEAQYDEASRAKQAKLARIRAYEEAARQLKEEIGVCSW
jgi:hypothetical protein